MLTEADVAKLNSEHFNLCSSAIDDGPLKPSLSPISSYGKSSAKSSKSSGKSHKSRYVYDYSKDRLERIKDGDEFVHQKGIKEIPIPLKPGRLPIRIDGTENIAAFVNISTELRFLRWIGAQDKLYVVGSLGGGTV